MDNIYWGWKTSRRAGLGKSLSFSQPLLFINEEIWERFFLAIKCKYVCLMTVVGRKKNVHILIPWKLLLLLDYMTKGITIA